MAVPNLTRFRKAHEKQKQRCYYRFQRALRRGEVVKPETCSDCGRKPWFKSAFLYAHHDDHSNPLEVRWLCGGCHGNYQLETFLSIAVGPKEWRKLHAKCQREGISMRALILGWLKNWVNQK